MWLLPQKCDAPHTSFHTGRDKGGGQIGGRLPAMAWYKGIPCERYCLQMVALSCWRNRMSQPSAWKIGSRVLGDYEHAG